MNQTATYNRCICNLTPEVRDILKILWKRGEIALFHNILLPVVRFLCLSRDQIIASRQAIVRDKRGRDNESTVH